MTERITHPGRLLSRFLDYLPLKKQPAAKHMGISRATMHRVIAEEGRITVDIAMRLERAFMVPAEFWLKKQTEFDLEQARASGAFEDITELKVLAESDFALIQAQADIALDDDYPTQKEISAVA